MNIILNYLPYERDTPAHGLPELISWRGVTMVPQPIWMLCRERSHPFSQQHTNHPIGKVKIYDNFHYLHFLPEKWPGNCAGMWDIRPYYLFCSDLFSAGKYGVIKKRKVSGERDRGYFSFTI